MSHIPRLQRFPATDRRTRMERLSRRARLCSAEHEEILSILAHGPLVSEPDPEPGTELDLLVVVQDGNDAQVYAPYFDDLDVTVRIRVLGRTKFREGIAAGEAGLVGARDRAVVLAGALPLEEIRAW